MIPACGVVKKKGKFLFEPCVGIPGGGSLGAHGGGVRGGKSLPAYASVGAGSESSPRKLGAAAVETKRGRTVETFNAPTFMAVKTAVVTCSGLLHVPCRRQRVDVQYVEAGHGARCSYWLSALVGRSFDFSHKLLLFKLSVAECDRKLFYFPLLLCSAVFCPPT